MCMHVNVDPGLAIKDKKNKDKKAAGGKTSDVGAKAEAASGKEPTSEPPTSKCQQTHTTCCFQTKPPSLLIQCATCL